MDLNKINRIKKFALIALFSDDELMQILVLKGGNALDLVYQIDGRSSLDLDFSIEILLTEEDEKRIGGKIEKVLIATFKENGFRAFDIHFFPRPPKVTPDMESFWGGYRVEFKVIEIEKFESLAGDLESARRQAQVFTPKQEKIFYVDISKFEYCKKKQPRQFDGYTIYVYTPEMIVFEKVRAICQQMLEYAEIVKNPTRSSRARDFYDIYLVLENFKIDLGSTENLDLLKCIFQAKRVPLIFIGKIPDYREYHRADFVAVRDTVKPSVKLREYDFYFDYVIEKLDVLKTLWIE